MLENDSVKNWTLIPYVRRLAFVWCRLFHRQHHDEKWFTYNYRFFECKKCGHGFRRPRKDPEPEICCICGKRLAECQCVIQKRDADEF